MKVGIPKINDVSVLLICPSFSGGEVVIMNDLRIEDAWTTHVNGAMASVVVCLCFWRNDDEAG